MTRLKALFALLIFSHALCISCESATATPSNPNPSSAVSHIEPSSQYITIQGSIYTTSAGDAMLMNRHSQQFVTDNASSLSSASANTPSGININITTDSPMLKLYFEAQAETNQFLPQYYSVYKNGEFVEKRAMNNFGDLIIKGTKEKTHWQIYLPIHTGVVFKGIDIDKESEVWVTPKDERAIYLAIGDSITHGIGHRECSSDETYPAILARGLDYQLYNVAISGSRIAPPIATYYDSLDIDLVTVLWGYNDWNLNTFTIDQLGDRYYDLLINLSQHQPDATIYAILPTYTTSTTPKYRTDKSIGINQLRAAERKAAEKAISEGHSNIKCIDGSQLTTAQDLADAVHLNHAGAKSFANNLLKVIGGN